MRRLVSEQKVREIDCKIVSDYGSAGELVVNEGREVERGDDRVLRGARGRGMRVAVEFLATGAFDEAGTGGER